MSDSNREQTIQKAESTPKTKTPKTTETGQPRVITASRFIQDSKKKELTPDNRLTTFDAMMADDAVYTAVNYTRMFIVKALYRGVVESKGSAKSDEAAKFINYCLHNMDYGTWWDAVNNMTTANIYGWSDLNLVVRKRAHGQYAGSRCIYKLSPRDQKSVYGWLWNDDNTEWEGLVQKPSLVKSKPIASRLTEGLRALATAQTYEKDYPILRSYQLIHVAYNATNNNPQGDSPLMHCYDAWYEKKLIEHFEVSGISKDLSGVLVVKVPSELLERAADPETYPEAAQELADIQQDAADMHQGKTTHILLTSDVDAATKTPLYDIELRGVTGGGGKNYMTSEVIDQKRKSIYNCFGAAFLLLGQNGAGSYALSSSQTSVHGQLVERDIMMYENVINTQLIPRLLAANGIYLDYEDMPVFKAADPDELSIDEIGKFIQRVKSVGALTPAMWKHLAKKGRLPEEGIDDIDFTDSASSRAGDGMKSPGQGTSTSVGGKDASSANTENGGSVSKSKTIACPETDRIFDLEGNIINANELDKEGNYK